MATRDSPGTLSLSNSTHLPMKSEVKNTPVMFPPGRRRLRGKTTRKRITDHVYRNNRDPSGPSRPQREPPVLPVNHLDLESDQVGALWRILGTSSDRPVVNDEILPLNVTNSRNLVGRRLDRSLKGSEDPDVAHRSGLLRHGSEWRGKRESDESDDSNARGFTRVSLSPRHSSSARSCRERRYLRRHLLLLQSGHRTLPSPALSSSTSSQTLSWHFSQLNA